MYIVLQGCLSIEVHQALGFRYQSLGVCQVKCWELMGGSGGKFHGRASLTGVEPMMSQCVNVGSLEYWMKLKLPITHSAKLYQVHTHTAGALACFWGQAHQQWEYALGVNVTLGWGRLNECYTHRFMEKCIGSISHWIVAVVSSSCIAIMTTHYYTWWFKSLWLSIYIIHCRLNSALSVHSILCACIFSSCTAVFFLRVIIVHKYNCTVIIVF